jgi:lysophospholipid acyltransferase (LPLAT)-like uncharacterized protein
MKRRILTSPIFALFVACLIRAYSRSFRLSVLNEQAWRNHLAQGGRVILCCWHQQFFPFIRPFRAYRGARPSLMISQSQDGSLIAGVAHRMGWQTVRGSSSRGGLKAMLGMIQKIREHGLGAHIVDGPRGPIGVVKNGIVHMAHETGAMIVPVYAEADRAWRFRSWDRFFVPKPFARVRIRFGDMIALPPAHDPATFEAQRALLEQTMQPRLT